ncbi:hypothetical protein TWF696_005573 [Orbilia brochopaga]|uniref:C2H2-type domain-containing protein n=1 Tax=Orbilia brochopaga TaxID=3140254 RepID=A0AAV9V225_9PEZI
MQQQEAKSPPQADSEEEAIKRKLYHTACTILTSISTSKSDLRRKTELQLLRNDKPALQPRTQRLDDLLDKLAFLLVARGDGDCIAVVITKLLHDKVMLLASCDSPAWDEENPLRQAAASSGRSHSWDIQVAANLKRERRREHDIEKHAAKFFNFIRRFHTLRVQEEKSRAKYEFVEDQIIYSVQKIAVRSRQLMKELRGVKRLDVASCLLLENEPAENNEYFVPPPQKYDDNRLATDLIEWCLEVENGDEHELLKVFLREHTHVLAMPLTDQTLSIWHVLFIWVFEKLDKIISSSSREKQMNNDEAVVNKAPEIVSYLVLAHRLTHYSAVFRRWISVMMRLIADDQSPRLPPNQHVVSNTAVRQLLEDLSNQFREKPEGVSGQEATGGSPQINVDETAGPSGHDNYSTQEPSQQIHDSRSGLEKKMPKKSSRAKTIVKKIWSTIKGKGKERSRVGIENIFPSAVATPAVQGQDEHAQGGGGPRINQAPSARERLISIRSPAESDTDIPIQGLQHLTERSENVTEDITDEYDEIFEIDPKQGKKMTNFKEHNPIFQKAYQLTSHFDTIDMVTQSRLLAKELSERGFSLTVLPHDTTRRVDCQAEPLSSSLAQFLELEDTTEETAIQVRQFLDTIPEVVNNSQQLRRLLSLNVESPTVHAAQHAELLLLEHILNEGKGIIYPYIGVSKPPCFICEAVFSKHQDYARIRDGHGHVYVAEIPNRISKDVTTEVFQIINKLAKAVTKDLYSDQKRKHLWGILASGTETKRKLSEDSKFEYDPDAPTQTPTRGEDQDQWNEDPVYIGTGTEMWRKL